jgi:hypothetical protein
MNSKLMDEGLPILEATDERLFPSISIVALRRAFIGLMTLVAVPFCIACACLSAMKTRLEANKRIRIIEKIRFILNPPHFFSIIACFF